MDNVTNRTLYGIIIEWDGQSPPGKWYRTLQQLTGFTIRARNTAAPLAGVAPKTYYTVAGDILNDIAEVGGTFDPRSNDFGGIAQEGMIILASNSLARALCLMLQRGIRITKKKDAETVYIKPSSVFFSTMTIESFSASEADEVALARIQSTLSQRGRRPAPQQFAITCYEDVRTYGVEAHAAIRCPKCGGQHIRPRLGEIVAYKDPGGDLIKAWLRLRFGYGHWENTGEGEVEPPALNDIRIKDQDELALVKTLASAPIIKQMQGLSRADQLAVLDAVMIARLRVSDERRTKARMEALASFFIMGGSPMDVSLSEGDLDIFDTTIIMGKDFSASTMLKHLTYKTVEATAKVGKPQFTFNDDAETEAADSLRYEPVDEGA